jgi:hypothetical protein
MHIFNPKTLDAESLSQEFCGACHRGVDTVAMMPDLGGINNVRFQPYRLFNSRGHDPKDARLACTACHDPHVDLEQGTLITILSTRLAMHRAVRNKRREIEMSQPPANGRLFPPPANRVLWQASGA